MISHIIVFNLGTFYLVRFGDSVGAGIIEFISNIVNITGNPLLDTIIFGIIGSISGSIAFGFVEMLFGFTGNYNSKDMSDVHWGVRVFIFVLLTFVLVKIAQFLRWIFSAPQVYYLLGFVVLIVLTVVLCLFFIYKKKIIEVEKPTEAAPTPQLENNNQRTSKIESQNTTSIDKCPFCGGRLVRRKGPYGYFLGCSNFPECKYTGNRE